MTRPGFADIARRPAGTVLDCMITTGTGTGPGPGTAAQVTSWTFSGVVPVERVQ